MAIRLRVEHGSGSGKTIRLSTPGRYRFGRVPASSLQIIDMKVSKEHFEIWIGNGQADAAAIRDLDSSHGTWVNAQRVTGPLRPLSPGDEIRVGMTVLRVLSDGPADEEAKTTEGAPSDAEWQEAKAGGTSMTSADGTNEPAKKPPARPGKPQPPDPLVGMTLGGYRILERVGSGGMGAVYKAEQLSLHREVALKVLAERLVSDSAFVDQFVNEARAAGALNHPNVVQVYDVGLAEGRHYFSMEFIHGGSLEDRLSGGPAPWEDALGWFQDAANALIFAEQKGILHRDIKPDNLMVSQDGTVKLCDLGLAKKSESADLLAQGIIGTPHFIAPEAIRRKLDVDRRADLYSLGCSFYRILAGKNAFPGASVKEILLAHLNQPPPRVSAAASSVPRELDDVVFRLMQKDPAARYEKAEDLWEALEKIRLQHGLAAHGLHPGRAKKVAVLVVILALVAVGGAAYYVLTQKPQFIHTTSDPVDREPQQPTITEEERRQQRETAAALAVSNMRIGAADKMGRVEDGENWTKPGWKAHVEELRNAATTWEGTQAAKNATEEADRIEGILTARQSESAQFQRDREKAVADLDAAVKVGDAVDEHISKRRYAEAEALVTVALEKLPALAERKSGTRLLIPTEDISKERRALEALHAKVDEAAKKHFDDAYAVASASAKAESVVGFEKAREALDEFLKAPAPPTGAKGRVAREVADRRWRIETLREEYQKQIAALLTRDLEADRKLYQALLRVLYDQSSDSGLYSRFKFGEAAVKATEAQGLMVTKEYKDLVLPHVRAANRLNDLVGRIAKKYLEEKWDDAVASPLWKSTARFNDVTTEGVTVASTIGNHYFAYRRLGIPWFLSTMVVGSKGAPRVALTADDREALGTFAEVALVAGDVTMLEAALAQWKAAGELDPSRAKALETRAARAANEAEAHRVIADALAKNKELNDEIQKYDFDEIGPEAFEAKGGGRENVKANQKRWIEKVVEIRRLYQRLEQELLDTVTVNVTSGEPPARARFVGEPRPPEQPPVPAEGPKAPPGGPPAGPVPDGPPEKKDAPPVPVGPGPGPGGTGPR